GLDVVPEPNPPGGGRAAEQRLEQRRLAGAIRADERDVLAALDRERRVLEERAAGHGERDAFRLDDHAPRALRLQKSEPQPAPRRARNLGARLFQALDLLQLRLRLSRLRGLVAEPLDEPLEARELLRLALGRAGGMLCASGLLAPPEVPLAG